MITVSEIFIQGGGVTKVAAKLGAPIGTVAAWANRGRIPAERVIDVESVTGIPRYKIRPDIYPPKDFLEQGGQ